jgi:hypothetical protein
MKSEKCTKNECEKISTVNNPTVLLKYCPILAIHFQGTLHLLLWDTHSLLSLALVSENNSYNGLNKMS